MKRRVLCTIVEDIDKALDVPGAIAFEGDVALRYVCPCGCGDAGRLPLHKPGAKSPSWKWDGDRERPTLEPSIRVRFCRPGVARHDSGNPDHWIEHWHGHLRGGVFQDC